MEITPKDITQEPKFYVPDYKDLSSIYKRFIDWCFENGLILNKCQFPAYFGDDQLRGIIATEDINPKEAIMFVPNKLLITDKMIRKHEVLAPIIEKYLDVFPKNMMTATHAQCLYFLYEKLKGEQSFWKPFFDTLSSEDSPYDVRDEIFDFVADSKMKSEILDMRKRTQDDWETKFSPILEKHKGVFPGATYEDFFWAYAIVNTRSLAFTVPSTLCAVMLDNLNHSDTNICYVATVNTKFEKETDEDFQTEQNYTKMGDYYDLSSLKLNEDEKKTDDNPENKPELTFQNYFIQRYQKFVEDFTVLKKKDLLTLNQKERQEKGYILLEKLVNKFQDLEIWDVPVFILSVNNDIEEETGDERNFSEVIEDIDKLVNNQAVLVRPNFNEKKFENDEKKSDNDQNKAVTDQKKVENDQNEAESDQTKTENGESKNDQEEMDKSYPWYKTNCEDTYIMIVNNPYDKIKKNSQVFITYGAENNMYCLLNYGFSLKDNLTDYVSFRCWDNSMDDVDFSIKSMIFYEPGLQDHEKSVKDPSTQKIRPIKDLSKEFECRLNKINLELIKYLRAKVLKSTTTEQLTKNTSNLKSNFNLKNINTEIKVLHLYIQILETLQSHNSRTLEECEVLYNTQGIDWQKQMILNVEISNKKIIKNHLKLIEIISGILNDLINGKYETFKQAYTGFKLAEESDQPDYFSTRFIQKAYLKVLSDLCVQNPQK